MRNLWYDYGIPFTVAFIGLGLVVLTFVWGD
jgi:hypothetical protein